MADEIKKYDYSDSSGVCHSIEISKKDFNLHNKEEKISDLKLKTKPTTFFKDAFKRFCKNKSSVVGAVILGALLVLSVIIPLVDTSDIVNQHPTERFLEPKLFNAGTGFWDGTKKLKNVPCDISTEFEGTDGNVYYYPYEDTYTSRAITNLSLPRIGFSDTATNSASGGFALLVNDNQAYTNDIEDRETNSATLKSSPYTFDLEKSYDLEIIVLEDSIDDFSGNIDTSNDSTSSDSSSENDENSSTTSTFIKGDFKAYFSYTLVSTNEEGETEESEKEFIIKESLDESKGVDETIENPVNTNQPFNVRKYKFENVLDGLNEELKENESIKDNSLTLSLDILGSLGGNAYVGINSINFSSSDASENDALEKSKISFDDANRMVLANKSDVGYWTLVDGKKYLYHAKSYVCDFTYDTYEAVYGNRQKTVEDIEISSYIDKGWLNSVDFDALYNLPKSQLNDEFAKSRNELSSTYLPIISVLDIKKTTFSDKTSYTLTCIISGYKYLGYTSMPRYLLGSDNNGFNLVKQVFVGLRNSLGLGCLTFAICFTFGLVIGALCGYFGGTFDIVAQRFIDILSGVPWIVIMTLCILHLGSNFWTFILAMCLTGWIGTSSITRTQFYRFRDREYTLASRTLGANNTRLIFRHILPNAMGTIITSSVLMIPSVIFSEATISYLGLGFQDMESLGVTLSQNQRYLDTYPHLILFPCAIMALIMISFNLFGNGLRDAFNPSLKGSD